MRKVKATGTRPKKPRARRACGGISVRKPVSKLSRAYNLRTMLLAASLIVYCTLAVCEIVHMRGLRTNEWKGWVGYKHASSPNYNDRPPFTVVNCIVLHSTGQHSLEGTIKVFEDPTSRVSAHFVVGKDGTVVQMVPLTKRAWHAGVSTLDGIRGVNDYSIGIEMSNLDNGYDPYPLAQYEAVAEIIRRCRRHYDIPDDRIVSHADIALPRGRKDDPLGFDIERVKEIADGTDVSPGSTHKERPNLTFASTRAKSQAECLF